MLAVIMPIPILFIVPSGHYTARLKISSLIGFPILICISGTAQLDICNGCTEDNKHGSTPLLACPMRRYTM